MIESRIGAEVITPARCAPRIGMSVDMVATTSVEITARCRTGAGVAVPACAASGRSAFERSAGQGQNTRLAAITSHTAVAADHGPATALSATTAASARDSDAAVA